MVGVDALQRVIPAALTELGDVRPGGKHAIHARDDQDLGILLQRSTDQVQFIHHLLVNGVPDLRAVEENHHPVLPLFHQEGAELFGREIRGRH